VNDVFFLSKMTNIFYFFFFNGKLPHTILFKSIKFFNNNELGFGSS